MFTRLVIIIRIIAILTLLLMVPYCHYLITYSSYRPLIFHRYSPGYFLYILLHALLFSPYIALVFLPRVRKVVPAKSLMVLYTVGWMFLLAIRLVAKDIKIVFDEYGWLYSAIFAVHSVFATGVLLQHTNERWFAGWTAIVTRAAVIGFGLLCAIGACEVALRLKTPTALRYAHFPDEHEFFQYHPLLGWTNRPRCVGYLKYCEFDHRVNVNSKGLRDKEHNYTRRPGIKRMLCLGDSFTWGYGVDQTKRFTEVLENKWLQRVEVINAGVPGYGTAQEWLWLREEGIKYHPDLVVLCFYVNDFVDNAEPMHGGYGRPLYVLENGGLQVRNVPVPRKFYRPDRSFVTFQTVLNRHLYTYRLLELGWEKLREGASERDDLNDRPTGLSNRRPHKKQKVVSSQPRGSNAHVSGQEITAALLKDMQRLCRETGAQFLVVLIAERQEIRPDDPVAPFYPQAYERARAICRRWRIDYLDLRPLLAQYEARGEEAYLHQDYHWNERGHRIAAEAIYRKITDESLLEGMKTAASGEKK